MCTKWRRVAWYIDADSLGDVWTCSMNYWDLSKASCNVEEDYNSEHEDCDDAENYKDFDVNEYLASLPKGSLDSCPVDSVKDVYCVRNKVWFKGKILKHLNSSETGRTSDSVLIHFQGWHSKYDESIDVDSGRIQPLGIFSNLPTTAEIRQKKLGRSAPVRSKSKESQKRNENKTGAASLNKKRKIATLSVKPPLKKIKKGSAVKE